MRRPVEEAPRWSVEIAQGARSTCGLSNVSDGLFDSSKRPILNQVHLAMLMHCGVTSAIVDGLDKALMDIAKGRRPELLRLVSRVLEGESFHLFTLAAEERDIVKTIHVLTARTLFSESWLEV